MLLTFSYGVPHKCTMLMQSSPGQPTWYRLALGTLRTCTGARKSSGFRLGCAAGLGLPEQNAARAGADSTPSSSSSVSGWSHILSFAQSTPQSNAIANEIRLF